jgi:GT2 family glycosyltransferase
MQVSAVVVSYEARELLLACLESLVLALEPFDGAAEIIVVDNGSRDGAPDAVRELFPQLQLIEMHENHGFATGINVGLKASSGAWLLLLNNDATIEPGAVSALLHAVADREEVGSAACQMRFVRGGAINSAGLGVDRLGVAFDRHIGEPPEAGESSVIDVFGASAGAALMRRSMLEQIGGFDDSFFMYLDDVDVAWRARMRGWRCLYVPQAIVHHHHSASSVHGSAFKHFHVGRNRVRLLAKHLPLSHLLRYGALIVAHDIAHVVVAGLGDRTLAPLRGRLRGLREWRTYRTAGRDRQPVVLSRVQGLRRALARRSGAARGTTTISG